MKAKKYTIWAVTILLLLSVFIALAKPINHLYTQVNTQKSADAAEPPYFTGVEDTTIEKGSLWSPYQGVIARDPGQNNVDISGYIEVEDNVKSNKWGTYKVYYSVKSPKTGLEATAERTVKVVVSSVSKATLTVPATKEIKKGDAFSNKIAMEGIVATDGDGTNLAARVSWDSSKLDTNTIGSYPVVYSVTGQNGQEVTAVSTIKVVEGSNEVIGDATIEASDKTVTEGDTFDYYEGVKAFDGDAKHTDISANVKHQGRVNTNSPGKYQVIYRVTGANGNEVTKSITVTVTKKQETITNATIQASDKTITEGDTFDYLKDVTAKDGDAKQTDITSKLTYRGTVDTSKPGKYTITYEVTGANGNKVTQNITVTVIAKPTNLVDATIFAENQTVYVGSTFDYKKNISAIDGDAAKTDITSKVTYQGTVNMSSPGVYPITYKVTGANGNEVSKTIQVTVIYKTGELSISKKLITATGEDFKATAVNPGDTLYYKITVTNTVANSVVEAVTVSDQLPAGLTYQADSLEVDNKKVANADLKAIHVEDLLGNKSHQITFAAKINMNTSGTITNVAGVTGKTVDNKQYEASTDVRNLENATINASDKEITVGDSFDYKKGVTAKDGDLAHTDITAKLTYDQNVNTSKAGIYTVTYKVTGKNGVEVKKAIKVTVKEKEVPVTNATITASDRTIELNESFDYMAGIKAVDGDKEKTDITNKVTHEGTVDTSKAGKYTVTYKVKGKNNNEVSISIKVTVVAKNAVITANDRSIQLGQSFDPLKEVQAKDTDGYQTDLTSKIKVKSNNVNTNKAGKYTVIYAVTGSNGNTVEKTIQVTVLPKDAEIIATDKTIHQGDAFDPKQGVSAIDGDGNNTDLTAKITIEKNTVDVSKAGQYEVTYGVIGSSKNKVVKTVKITVIANQGDLTITKKVENAAGEDLNQQTVIAGDEIIYKIKVKNPIANSAVQQVALTDTVPAGAEVQTDAVTVKGTKATPVWKGNKVTLTAGTVTDKDEIEVIIPVKVKADYSGELTNIANVTGEAVADKNASTSIGSREANKASIIAINKKIEIGNTFDPLQNVTAIDEDGSDITASLKVISNNVDPLRIGVYKVVYEAEARNGKITKEIEIEVIGRDATIIADDQELYVNDSFDPLGIVTAIDGDGVNTDISRNVRVINSNVDTSVSGNYQVTFAVVGINGNEISKTVKVKVIANDAVIQADNRISIIGEDFDARKEVRAIDGDGRETDLTADLKITMNTVDTQHAGEYDVRYEVTGENGNLVSKTIRVTIVAKDAVIQATDKKIAVGDSFDPLKDVTAVDGNGYDTDLTSNINITANTVDTSHPGNYTVTYSVTGENGNEVTKTINVVVQENPGDLTISKEVANTNGNTTAAPGDEIMYTIKVKNPTTKGNVHEVVIKDDLPKGIQLNEASIKVNQENASYELAGNKLKLTIGDILANEEKVITFKAKVTAEAAVEITNIAKVTGVNTAHDSEADAVIEGEYQDASIYAFDKTIQVGDKFDPRKAVTAKDSDDRDLTAMLQIKENTVDTNQVGEYKVVYGVTGKNKKEVVKEVKITVVSKNAIIVVDDSTLTLGDSFDPMKGVRAYDGNVSLVQKAASQATDITSAVTIESNNVDTKKVGEYQVVYTVAGSNGIQVKKTRKISILAKDAVIKAENSTIKVGETFQPLKTVKAYDGDEKHTDISAKIEVKQNKVDNKKVGSYPVTYAVVGSNGKEITKQIAVTVKKDKKRDSSSGGTKPKDPEIKPDPSDPKDPKDPNPVKVTETKAKKAVKRLLKTGDVSTIYYTGLGSLLIIGAWLLRRYNRNNWI